jgi:uncharacterized protein YbbC (DUF1343 family)
MKSLDAAILYPGPGTLETTSLSVGRGSDQAFLAYGAPWVEAGKVVLNLSRRSIPGIRFDSCSFVPQTPGFSYKGFVCQGVCLTILDREQFDPVLTGLHLVQAFQEVHPLRFKAYEGFATEVGDREVWGLLTKSGMKPERILAKWEGPLQRFRETRKRYLIYAD